MDFTDLPSIEHCIMFRYFLILLSGWGMHNQSAKSEPMTAYVIDAYIYALPGLNELTQYSQPNLLWYLHH